MLTDLKNENPALAKKINLLENCISPVVVPGATYSEQADAAFARFVEAGMHLVKSTDNFLSYSSLLSIHHSLFSTLHL